MNACFRTAWLTLLVTLSLINPGLLSVNSDGCSHASGNAPPTIVPIRTTTSAKPAGLAVVRREGPLYAVQSSAYRDEKNARSILERLANKGYTPNIHSWKDPSGKLWHFIIVGVYEEATEAARATEAVKAVEAAEFAKIAEAVVAAAKTPKVDEVPKTEKTTEVAEAEETVSPDPKKKVPEGSLDIGGEMSEVAEEEWGGPEFTYSGFIEFESFVNTGGDGSFRERNKKNEIRNRLQMKYGTENFFLYSVSNVYLLQTYLAKKADDYHRYAKDQQVSRNLRLSSREAELSFDELYLNYGRGNFRLRAGNQIYGWGTADAFNPTSYFNPSDMREIFFRDDDENKVGVPSLSGMFFLGDYTLEAVFVPVHITPIMAPEGSFWAFSINSVLLPIVFENPEPLDANIANVGYGARLSTSRGGVDMSVSGYRGPDKNPLFLPYEIVYQGMIPVPLRVTPHTSIVTMFGFDISAALGDFVVQFEAAYSPDKMGIVEMSATNIAGLTLPLPTDRAHFLSYAAGFNYFIPMDRLIEGHTGNSVFTFEWFKSRYLEDGLYAPLITDIVSCKFEDSYFDGRVKTTVKGIFDMKYGGKVLWPEIGYDFQNGFLVDVGYAAIWMEKGSFCENASIFHYFKDNDIVMGTVRYEY